MGFGDLDGSCADNGSRKRDRPGSAEHQEDARILLDRARGIRGRRICRDIESRCFGSAVLSAGDRKSTLLNSSHTVISYAVFCLKKKKYRKRRSGSWHRVLRLVYRARAKRWPDPGASLALHDDCAVVRCANYGTRLQQLGDHFTD